jgi:hypothetical protein
MLTSSALYSAQLLPKQALKTNGLLIYNVQQKHVSTFKDMLQKGNIFGRLRTNNFYFAYNHQDKGHQNSLAGSLGASFVYKTASLSGFDFTLGLYGSQAFFNPKEFDNNIKLLKSAKDTFSRYKYVHTGSKAIYAFGQANINYRYSKTDFTLGRQLVDTFYTKSNDTKMIPNTFDGFTISSKDLKKTTLKFAYLTREKLRNHENNHALFMYDDSNPADYSYWSGNDDSAMHRGISYTRLKAAGKATDAPLIVVDAKNNSLKKLQINLSAYAVPSLLSQVMGELNYTLNFKNFRLIPGIRYIEQFDNGAGAIGGASLLGNATQADPHGYKDPNSLNAQMIAARLAAKIADYKITFAYTNVLDKADLVTPWRGFPTAGYTRSMGVYNWRANTRSYRLELIKNANAKGVYIKPFLQASILYIDADEKKAILEDSIVYYFGIVQNISSMPEIQYRVRLGYRDFIGDASKISSYLDTRFEINYLF